MATAAPYLVEEILEEILIRLPTPAALVRASTACASFRRIITARSFLRRYRKLHPPPLLGFAADDGGYHPAEAPHPSAPLARALADAADFSYSYVPKPDDGVFTTSPPGGPATCATAAFLLCDRWFRQTWLTIFRKVLAVCDPLSRRYVLLPPFPVDTTLQLEPLLGFEPILAPIGDDEDETPCRVLCWASYESKFSMFVFSAWSLVLDTCLGEQAACIGHLQDGVFHCQHPHQLPYAAYKSDGPEQMQVLHCCGYRRNP